MKRRVMSLVAPLMRKITGDPSCEEINRFLADYVDNALDSEVAARYERHVKRLREAQERAVVAREKELTKQFSECTFRPVITHYR